MSQRAAFESDERIVLDALAAGSYTHPPI